MRGVMPWLVAAVAVLSFTLSPGVLASHGASPLPAPIRGAGSQAPLTAGSFTPMASTPVHDLMVSASNATSFEGGMVNFTVTAPPGVSLDQYVWQFGDGSEVTTSVPTVGYAYPSPGSYLVYVVGSAANGSSYDNLHSLLPYSVQPSYAADLGGDAALLDGAVQQNSTSNTSAVGDISPGGSVLVANWVDAGPNSPFWTESTPVYSVSTSAQSFATLSPPVLNVSGIDAEAVSFGTGTPFGLFQLYFSETTISNQPSGGSDTTQFVFTILVATGAATVSPPPPVSPHKGTLNAYLTAPGYQFYADPGTAYSEQEAAFDDDEYQTLVAYNGSQAGPNPSDYVPDLATCVPGPQCQARYGSSLISPNGDYTFVIDPNATFYNASTGAHYPVWPNDVAFSIVRACLLTDYPGYVIHGSWILCQALLPASTANSSWDSGLHSPLNSTPANLLAAVTVNDSAYCTAAMMNGIEGAGCVTLHTALSGQAWPELLEFVASPFGASVVSCQWLTSVGFGLPGWETGTTCNGAPPSTPPGPDAWDQQEVAEGGDDWGGLQANASSPLAYHAVGSGPYALESVGSGGSSLHLIANPYWGGTDCTGGLREGCLPPANHGSSPTDYIGTVNMFFNPSTTNQTEAVLNGSADIAGVQTPFDPGFLEQEVVAGDAQLVDIPAINEMSAGFDMSVNLTAAQQLTATPLSFPAHLAEDLNFRQFLIHSFPTPQLQSGCITDGVEECFQAGGAIPAYMAPYYPSNISWYWGSPDSDPSDVGGAAWWWAQTAADGLDGAICTAASPCTFPLVVSPQPQLPLSLPVVQDWASNIQSLSGGALKAVVVSLNASAWDQAVTVPGEAAPVIEAAWLPDYFDPSDYANAFYAFETSEAFYGNLEQYSDLASNATLNAQCAGPTVDPTVTNGCQGSAVGEMNTLVAQADGCAPPACSSAQRALLYNMAEQIARSLGLYQNMGQGTVDYLVAPWIDSTTVSRSPFAAGWGGQSYYVQYRGSVPYGYPLVVSPVSDPAPGSGALRPLALFESLRPVGSPNLTVEAGETIVFSVTAAGGSGVYDFSWAGLPPGCPTANSPFVVCTPTAGANVSVSVVVTDSVGDEALSGSLAVTVVPRAVIEGVTITPGSITIGASIRISVNESGGLSPLLFSYVGLPPGCTSANASSLNCTPAVVGTYAVVAQVTDRLGVTALGSASLIVTAAHSSSPPSSPTSSGWSSEFVIVLAVSAAALGFLIGAVTMRRVDRRKPPGTNEASPSAPSKGPDDSSPPFTGAPP